MSKKTLLALALAASTLLAQAQETLKIATIEPLSGPMGEVGTAFERLLRFAVEQVNARGGIAGQQLELLSFDNKFSAQESQAALTMAIDQGVKAIFMGAGSSGISAVVSAIERTYARNPEKAVVLFNFSSYDPDLVGKQCSFWHFMTDLQVPMRMKAIAELVKQTPDIQKIYFLNPDYSFGRQWTAYGKTMLANARPDIELVGESFFPTGTVKDFAPYVAKMRAAGADTVVSGNWANDMALLVRAAGESGYKLRILNHSNLGKSTLMALDHASSVKISTVSEWFPGQDNPAITPLAEQFNRQYKEEPYTLARLNLALDLFAEGVKKADSTDPKKVAAALEDLTVDSLIGPMKVRKEDHQVLSNQYVYSTHPVDGDKVKEGFQGTGQGFVPEVQVPYETLMVPNACNMKRPS